MLSLFQRGKQRSGANGYFCLELDHALRWFGNTWCVDDNNNNNTDKLFVYDSISIEFVSRGRQVIPIVIYTCFAIAFVSRPFLFLPIFFGIALGTINIANPTNPTKLSFDKWYKKDLKPTSPGGLLGNFLYRYVTYELGSLIQLKYFLTILIVLSLYSLFLIEKFHKLTWKYLRWSKLHFSKFSRAKYNSVSIDAGSFENVKTSKLHLTSTVL